MKGFTIFGGKLAALSGFVGGSVLVYVVFVADLALPWVLLIGLGALSLIYGIGAYELWSAADGAAYRFAPTWEQLQTRADTLRGLAHEADPATFKRVNGRPHDCLAAGL